MNFNQNRQQMSQNFQNNTANFGAHEAMEIHEMLTHTIDSINQFELYRPHVQDQRLMHILDNQLNHKVQGYNNMVNFLQRRGSSNAVPYRTPMTMRVKYGLRNPAPDRPNTDINQMNDQDVASGVLCCHKASAQLATIAALECADPTLRNLMSNCIQNNINMAFEIFQYMNEKGYYQVPTMQENTTQTIINHYQEVPNVNLQNTRHNTYQPMM